MKNITITGVLVAEQWETDGNITELALLTDDESKYLISPEEFGENYNAVLRKIIKVSAVLITESQERRIRVLRYSPVSPSSGWP